MPLVSRAQARLHTDHYAVEKGVLPAEQHQAITKPARKAYHIERFNTTLRQRVSHLVREALSFSKTLANHLGAMNSMIKFFVLDGLPS
jgi:insertion element IS1 protein InsB